MAEYYHSKESVAEYISMAKDVDSSQLIAKFEKHLQPGSYVLEMGSGPGTDWEILSRTFKVIGSDLSKEFLKYLSKKHPNHSFLELDAVTLDTNKTFEGIYSNKVLQHLTDD